MQNFETLGQPLLGARRKKWGKKVAYLSCSTGHKHFARTNLPMNHMMIKNQSKPSDIMLTLLIILTLMNSEQIRDL